MKQKAPFVEEIFLFFSVIIPAYNSADHISKTINSILNQSFKDLEIIIVNDGSTDNTYDVINGYSQNDKRIRIINKKNEGVNLARCTGIEKAKGKYIHFLDSDDIVEKDAYMTLYEKSKENDPDMIFFDFMFLNEEEGLAERSVSLNRLSYNATDLIKEIWVENERFSVWQFIHKRSIYDKDNFVFFRRLNYGEDILLSAWLILNSRSIEYLPQIQLNYIIKQGSLTHSAFTADNRYSLLIITEIARRHISRLKEYETLRPAIAALELRAYATIFKFGDLSTASLFSKRAMSIFEEFPDLKYRKGIKAFRKLFILYYISENLGKIFAKYYRYKKKIIN